VSPPFAVLIGMITIAGLEMIQVRKATGTYQGIVRCAAYLGDAIDYDIEVAGQLLTTSETNPLQLEVYI
jgi:hypothetical protein